MPERAGLGFGRRDAPGTSGAPIGPDGLTPEAPWPDGATKLDDELVATLLPERPARGHKGSFGKLLVLAGRSTMPGRRSSCVARRHAPVSGS
jgi:hypothetical protein